MRSSSSSAPIFQTGLLGAAAFESEMGAWAPVSKDGRVARTSE